MKTIRVQIPDGAYEALLRLQGKQQEHTGNRATLSTACMSAFHIAMAAVESPDDGFQWMLFLDADGNPVSSK